MTTCKIQKIVKNCGMVLEIIRMTQFGNRNTVLLQRITDGEYITCRDLEFSHGLECSWYWGHYFSKENYTNAVNDFTEREKEMLRYDME